jgi:hypothetical protein
MSVEKDSCWLIARMIEEFPGLIHTELDIEGSELIQWISYQLNQMPHLKTLMPCYEVRAK